MTEAAALTVVIELSEVDDPNLAERVTRETGAEVRVIERHGLAGDAASWLLIGNFIVGTLTALLPLLTGYLNQRRVKSIKIGDLVIENPTAAQVDQALAAWRERPGGPA